MTSPLESGENIPQEQAENTSTPEMASPEELIAFADEMDKAVREDLLISQAIVKGFHDNTLRGGFSKTPSVRMPLEDRWVFFKDKSYEFTFRRYNNNEDGSYSVEQVHVFKGEVEARVRYWTTGGRFGDSHPPVNAKESLTKSKAMWAEYKRQQEEAATQQTLTTKADMLENTA